MHSRTSRQCSASWRHYFTEYKTKAAYRCHHCHLFLSYTTDTMCPAVAGCMMKRLVHSYVLVASRVDCCCSLLFRSLRTVIVKLQRVLNAAARVVTNTLKYDRGLHHTMRHKLHWLEMTDRVEFPIAVIIYCYHTRCCSRIFDRTMFSCYWKIIYAYVPV